jgi:hypothetical protein
MMTKSKTPGDVQAAARKHSNAMIRSLAAMAKQEDGSLAARVSAAQALLDRAWGKTGKPVANEDVGVPAITRIERVIIDSKHSNQGSDDAGGGTRSQD